MTVFGSKVLKAYVILLWSGAVPRGGGGGAARGQLPPPPWFYFCLSAQSSVMYIDDENTPNPLWLFSPNFFFRSGENVSAHPLLGNLKTKEVGWLPNSSVLLLWETRG